MKKIKVCIVGLYAYQLFDPACKVGHGGAEVDLYLLAKELAKDPRYDVWFVVGNSGQPEVQKFGNVTVVSCFQLKIRKPKYLTGLIRESKFLWQLMKINADVYIQEAAGTITGTIALASLIRRKKFIYRVAHDNDCNKSFIKSGGSMGNAYWLGLSLASRVIAQNEWQQEMLLKFHRIKSIIVGNAHMIPAQYRGEKGSILWIARCEEWKRPNLFLGIVRKFPDQKFTMIAPRQAHELVLFEKISKEAAGLSNLTFIEKVPFAEVQDYFNRAKIFVGTSDFEGFPNTYLHACIGGTPIISLSVNPNQFITKYNLGYCSGGNMDQMMGQIKKILDDEQDWKEKSANAYAYVKKNHDIQEIKKQWDGIIQEIL